MATSSSSLSFGGFTIDQQRRILLRDGVPVRLRAKAWGLLSYLAARPGSLVTPDELYPHLWPDTVVEPQALAHLVWELRRALGDDQQNPRFIETIPKRGYRFIACEDADTSVVTTGTVPVLTGDAEPVEESVAAPLIGRGRELQELSRLWRKAQANQRQIAFVGGEAGIGKTTLLDEIIRQVVAGGTASVFRGHCLQQHGSGEPYMPVLEAFGKLQARPDVVDILQREAPTWLVQMPWMMAPNEMHALRTALAGSGHTRMLREGGRLLARLSERAPVLLVIEDAHWADPATIDLLSLLAETREAARLLVIVSYRPVDMLLADHPLRMALARLVHRSETVSRIALDPLSTQQVGQYLDGRLPGIHWGESLMRSVERISGGNPLFLRSLSDDLIARGIARRVGESWELTGDSSAAGFDVPIGLRNMVLELAGSLSSGERELLEAGAAAGIDFSARDVAAALDRSEEAVESGLRDIADLGCFLRHGPEMSWPDGSASSRFTFVHALYRDALYDRIATLRRRQWHGRIGDRLTRDYPGPRALEIAALAASHYRAAGAREKEVPYLELAAANANQRFAYRESRNYLIRLIEALQTLPESEQRDRHEAERQLDYINLTLLIFGFAEPSVSAAVERVLLLGRRHNDWLLELRAWLAESVIGSRIADPERARSASNAMLAIAATHPQVAAAAHLYDGVARTFRSEFREALNQLGRAKSYLDVALPDVPRIMPLRFTLTVMHATVLAYLGQLTDAARAAAQLESDLEREASPIMWAQELAPLSYVYLIMGNHTRALALAEKAIALDDEHGFEMYTSLARCICAVIRYAKDPSECEELIAALAERERRAERGDLAAYRVYLAEMYLDRGERARALAEVSSIVGGYSSTADTWRVRGEILGGEEGEKCFQRAVLLAREQGYKLAELRALTSHYRVVTDATLSAQVRAALEAAIPPLGEDMECVDAQRATAALKAGPPRRRGVSKAKR